MSVRGRSTRGRLEEHASGRDNREFQFATISNMADKVGLDVRAIGVYRVGAIGRIAELGSTDTIIKLTAHDFKVGDLIRPIATTNPIEENFFTVKRIIDVDYVEIDAVLSHAITAGDTFEILRPVIPRYTSDGASLASVISGPTSFNLDGAVVEVNVDTVTQTNTVPLPVALYGLPAGTPINLTAGDINVQLSHVGAVNYDSVRVGDGADLLAITAAGQATVEFHGDGVNSSSTKIYGDTGNLLDVNGFGEAKAVSDHTRSSTKIGDGSQTLEISAVGQAEVHFDHITNPSSVLVGDGSETLAISAVGQAEVHFDHITNPSSVLVGDGTTLLGIDLGNQAKVVATHTGLYPSSMQIGDGADIALVTPNKQLEVFISHAVNPSSVQIGDGTHVLDINANLQAEVHSSHITNPSSVQIGDGSEIAQVTALGELNVISSQLPATLGTKAEAASVSVTPATEFVGQKAMAASIPVVFASNQTAIPIATLAVKEPIDKNIAGMTQAAYMEIVPTTSNLGKAITLFMSAGEPVQLALGAAGFEAMVAIIPPGGFPGMIFPIDIPVGSRISAKVSANGSGSITSGLLLINILG